MSEWERFDEELIDAAAGLPPGDDTVKAVTPWGRCMSQVVLGLILTSFTLDFLWLQYLLPAIGVANLYLAFRSLRENNRWFRLCWLLSGLRAALFLFQLAGSASPFSTAAWFSLGAGYAASAVVLCLYFFFRLGLRKAAAATGHRPSSDPLLLAMIWYLVMLGLALFIPNIGWLGVIPLIALFIVVIRLLTESVDELDAWGYQVRAAPVKISAAAWRRAFYLSAVGLTVMAALLSSHIPVRAQPVEQTSSTALAGARRQLLEQGLPQEYLSQLPDSEVEKLRGAVRLDHPEASPNPSTHVEQYDAYYALFPDETVRILCFYAVDNSFAFWQCGVQARLELETTDISGRIFWSQGARDYLADVAQNETGVSVTTTDWFFGEQTMNRAAASYSWPLGSQDRHGWLIFTVDFKESPKTMLNTNFFYGQSKCFFHLPYRSVFDTGDLENIWFTQYYGDGSSLAYKADQEDPNWSALEASP